MRFRHENVDESLHDILLEAIQTKLIGRACTVTEHKDISSWAVLKKLLEDTYCATRTPGYLLLDLATIRFQQGETVQQYASRMEKLIHKFSNVSANGKPAAEAKIISTFIKETALTIFVEGLPNTIRGIMKSRNLSSIEEAIKQSLEEEKIYLSNKDAQRLIQGKSNTSETNKIFKGTNQNTNGNQKFCNICKRNNHFTSQCRYANRDPDTGQQSLQHLNTKNKEIKKITCTYCKKPGHSREECFKRKNADTHRYNRQQESSGNESRPSGSGNQSVKTLKTIALNLQEPYHAESN